MSVRIDKKLTISFVGMAVITAALAAGWWISDSRLTTLLDQTIHETAATVEKIDEIRTAAMQLRVAQRGYILYSILKQPQRVQDSDTQFRAAMDQIKRSTTAMRSSTADDQAGRAVAEVEAGMNEWRPQYQRIVELVQAEQYGEELNRAVDATFGSAKKVDDGGKLLSEFEEQTNEQVEVAAADLQKFGRITSVSLIVLALIISAGVLATIFNISRVLRSTAHQLGNACDQIHGAAGNIAGSSQTLAQGASEQAASLEEASASAEEINSMSRSSAEQSAEANSLSRSAAVKLTNGAKAFDGMRTSMNEVATSSRSIGRIIKVIDDIAFQTNILALNAAVEAARAGNAGAGFAVVADEVRNLAQRSATAASETASLIEDAIARSQQAKVSLEAVSLQVTEATSEALRVTKYVEDIHASSRQQADGVEQIATAVMRIQEVTQNNAASAEESAAATEELNAQAAAMRDIVRELQGMVGR